MVAYHIYPVDDWLPHDTDSGDGVCRCEPKVVWIDPDTELPWASGDGPLVVHNAFDGRE